MEAKKRTLVLKHRMHACMHACPPSLSLIDEGGSEEVELVSSKRLGEDVRELVAGRDPDENDLPSFHHFSEEGDAGGDVLESLA